MIDNIWKILKKWTKFNLQKYLLRTYKLGIVSDSINVQLVSLLKYSGQSDNTVTQGIYNKSNVHKNNTPRYML